MLLACVLLASLAPSPVPDGPTFRLAPLHAEVAVEGRTLTVVASRGDRLAAGDRIVGVGTTRFAHAYVPGVGTLEVEQDGPLEELGHAVVDAWSADGALTLAVERDGAVTSRAFELDTLPAFGPDFPWECAWSRAEAARLALLLAGAQDDAGRWPGHESVTALCGLALLATGDDAHLPAVERAAAALRASPASDAADWRAPYRGILIAELQLRAPAPETLAALRTLAATSSDPVVDADQPNLHRGLRLALLGLLRDLELPVDARTLGATRVTLDRATGPTGWVTRGREDDPSAEALGEHAPTAAAVLGFAATSTPEELVYDHRYGNTGATHLADHPHWLPHATASPGAALHLAALATARTDPQATRRLAEVVRWRLALSRSRLAGHVAQPARAGLATDLGEGADLWTSASVLLLLTAPRAELRLSGRPLAEFPAKGAERR